MAVTAPPLRRPPAWPGWRQLPRDARDTLFLVGVIGWTVLPHLGHLPLWCALLTGVVLLWRARLALANEALPSRWLLIVVLCVATGLTLWTHRTLLGKEAGVTMLVVLMALKTLELRARRDAFVVFFLGFFVVLTQFLYAQTLPVAVAMLVAVWGLLTALVLAHMPVGQPALRHAASLAARCALLGTPVMVLLFVLFPRIGPLWGVPNDGLSTTGLSMSMQMGSIAELVADDSVALRIRFAGAAPPPEALYFRGPVLGRFDGREWLPLAPTAGQRAPAELRVAGRSIDYEMTLEPSRLALLPLLEATPEAPRIDGLRVTGTDDLQWRTNRPVAERVRFKAQARLRFELGPLETVPSLRAYLQLPPGANPRTIAWAEALRAEPRHAQADAQALSAAVLDHIRSAGFVYTLTPGIYAEDGNLNGIDEFWLDQKQGFCEHYAAAYVVVMRAMGVPARVVTGYQGADAEPVDGFHIVRQSNAHAWAEYWEEGRGWLRADPTAAVAPDRIVRSLRLQPAPGLVASAIGGVSPALLARLRSGWEGMNNRWNQWVLNYSRGQQLDLLKDIGFSAPSWEDLALLLIGALSGLSLAGAAWAWWERQRVEPWARELARLRATLRALGIDAAAHESPGAIAQRVASRYGATGATLAALLARLELERYGRSAQHDPPLRASARSARRGTAPRTATIGGMRSRSLPSLLIAAGAATVALSLALAIAPAEGATKQSKKAQQAAKAKKSKAPHSAPAKTDAADSKPSYAQREDVMRFGAEIAERNGLDPAWVLTALAAARYQPSVVKYIMPPPAGTAKNWAAYRDRFVEPRRIRAGVAFWRANEGWLLRAEDVYGVPPEIIVGIIGVETIYGEQMGSFRVLDALTTLAFDFPPGRKDRSAFFRDELEQLFVQCSVTTEHSGCDPLTPKGSFAGAQGMPQFMPGSVNKYAVDFDADGRIDLSESSADVIGSVAHYLSAFGWQRGMPTRYEVAVPVDAADRALLLVPDIVPSFSAAQFAERGAQLPPEAQSHAGLLALVELQNGDAAPSYVAGTANFYAITRYNWSSYYAMAVIELGEAVKRQIGTVR